MAKLPVFLLAPQVSCRMNRRILTIKLSFKAFVHLTWNRKGLTEGAVLAFRVAIVATEIKAATPIPCKTALLR